MDKVKLEAWLGRSLTPVEIENQADYLLAATQWLEGLLCYQIASTTAVTKVFKGRERMATVFMPVFTTTTEVKLNGSVTTAFTPYFFDNPNGTYFNSLVFDSPLDRDDKIEVTGDWGFSTIPLDLMQLLAKMFNHISLGVKSDANVKSKSIEDFSISYDTTTTEEGRLIDANRATISKYSICHVGNIRSGRVGGDWCGFV